MQGVVSNGVIGGLTVSRPGVDPGFVTKERYNTHALRMPAIGLLKILIVELLAHRPLAFLMLTVAPLGIKPERRNCGLVK